MSKPFNNMSSLFIWKMPLVIRCEACGRCHTIEEYEEERFCRECGSLLPKRVQNLNKKNLEEGEWPLFPYTPYPQQLEFMRDVKEIIVKGETLIAEACNGFGKTVSSLSVLLGAGNRIIHATRTHEQVRQVLTEIKAINDKSERGFRAVNLASRGHLCINPECRDLPRLEAQELCQTLRQDDDCPFRSEINHLPKGIPLILSVKSLLKVGKRNKICPYYLARQAISKADVVVAPYPYIFDPFIRRSVGLQLEGRTLILDEGHNIDQVGQDILSDTLNENSLGSAAEELRSIRRPTTHINRLLELLRRKVENKPKVCRSEELERDVELVLGIDIASFIDRYAPLVDTIKNRKAERGDPPLSYLNGLLQFLELLIKSRKDRYIAVYRRSSWGVNTVEYRCMDPSLAIKPVVDSSSGCLIMSGTISPLGLFAEIIGMEEATLKAYPSIQDPSNVRMKIDTRVTSAYRERSIEMMTRMGQVIAEEMRGIPNGALIFFTQRGFMDRCLDAWALNGILKTKRGQIYLEDKVLFREGRDAKQNRSIVSKYKQAATTPSGAVLCCVFRGRNSEGSNFPGRQARGIFLLGVPYANYGDPLIRAQIRYFNKRRSGMGNRWYTMDAFRAANQALGRGIRGIDDWCHYWLLDRRYESHKKLISRWAQGNGVEIIS
ncbi:MAG: helicase C-terminal domain-containing protein [Candidatus Bathyarchaeia archaeon]